MRQRALMLALTIVATSLVFLAPSSAQEQDFKAQMERQSAAFEDSGTQATDLSAASEGPAQCRDGTAGGTYPCSGIDMLSHVSLADLGLTFVNDIWGWTDPQTRKHYALVGGTEGTAIVDVTQATQPDVVGILPAHSLDPQFPFWRDIKVYADHMFVVSEQLGHGMQVFDLTQVRGVTGPPVPFPETAHYDEFSAHNLNINTDTGFAYVVGARNLDRSLNCAGGLHMVDISEPADPAFAGCFSEHGYIHDTQCVVYQGPDADHRGREICFNSNAEPHHGDPTGIVNAVSIVDVSDKSNPTPLARMEYANDGYSHQGWLTSDQRYFLHGDELDEVSYGIGTTTRVWDVGDLESPTVASVFENDTTSIDHNIYTKGRAAYASNYTSGLRIYDLRNLPTLSELAFFDVYPENDNASFEGGTWSNYAFFRGSQMVAVSSMDRGLFVLQPRIGSVAD
jgi:choice-of-anchor B domain-containing protein